MRTTRLAVLAAYGLLHFFCAGTVWAQRNPNTESSDGEIVIDETAIVFACFFFMH